jgi:hypothetical protein
MAIIQGLIPPSRENWELISKIWQLFPLVRTAHPSRSTKLPSSVCAYSKYMANSKQFTAVQWLTTWYPMGKTSIESKLNIPGRIGWMTMEAPGFILLLYIMFTLPGETGMESVPISNWAMAGMFVCFLDFTFAFDVSEMGITLGTFADTRHRQSTTSTALFSIHSWPLPCHQSTSSFGAPLSFSKSQTPQLSVAGLLDTVLELSTIGLADCTQWRSAW